MKLNLKYIVALTFILITTAYGDNRYWEDFEEKYRQGRVKNVVEHIDQLADLTLIRDKKDLDDL